MITRRGLFGMLAIFRDWDALPGPVHEHAWKLSPYLVTAVGPEPPLYLTPVQICAVKDCGMLRVLNGDRQAGKAHIEDK
jgi:hypothetical protein